MRYLSTFLRIFVGLIFILSGITKLYPIEPFENVFIEWGISNWNVVPFLARGIIAFELFIGLAIIFNLWLKNSVYYLAQTSLFVFTAYLVYLLITKGNNVDCGCFGSWIILSPIESIIKNFTLIIALYFVQRQYHRVGVSWGVTLIVSVSLAVPILLNPIGLHNVQGIEVNEKVDFSGLPLLYGANEKVDFSSGKKIVAFFSNTCPHCINASRKFSLLSNKQTITNLYYVVGAKKEEGLLEFIEKTNSDFPIIWMNDEDFFKYSGGRLPAIVYLEDGVIKKKWFGDLFDVEEVKMYLE